MTEVENCGGGHRTRLKTNFDVPHASKTVNYAPTQSEVHEAVGERSISKNLPTITQDLSI